jgi:translation initiation factor 2 subunit 2
MATKPDFDYSALLARAKKELPEVSESDARWELPEPDVIYEGRMTILRNIDQIVSAIRREEQHLVTFLLREFGTAGGKEGDRLIFQGNLPTKQIQERLQNYVNTYVLCSECHRPDTHLEKDERTVILKCEGCGARKPITVRRVKPVEQKKDAIEEGKVYEVFIQDISQRGDGVAKMDRFTIFVPKGRKGMRVRVLIEKISGNIGFAKIQP